MIITMARRGVAGAVAALLFSNALAWAADHRNLEEGNPTQIEDAAVIAYRSIELQPVFTYEKDGERGEIFLLEPEVNWGLMKNAQLELRVPVFVGVGDRTGSGDIELEALYNFNVETQFLPATAFRVGFAFPTGKDSSGVHTIVKAILTKGLRRGRFHLNAGFTNIGDPEARERDFRYRVALGADHPLDFGVLPLAIGLDNLAIFDVVVEQSALEGDNPLWLAEVGWRGQVNPWTLLTLGAGAGLSNGAPDYLVTVGFQYTFAAF